MRRPRRSNQALELGNATDASSARIASAKVLWAASFGVWAFFSLAATITIYQMYRLSTVGMRFSTVAGMEFSQILAYVPVTPFVFMLAVRHPLRRGHWLKQTLLYMGAGLAFTIGHILVRGFTPYAFWDSTHREWASAFWDAHAHGFRFSWFAIKTMFLGSVVDDFTSYIPIVIIAHALLYHRRSQEKELRATQLAGQLTKAHLETLKSQLQPHFLFNTLHSISSLMLTNVVAADRMMTSLSDLLRMSLEGDGSQLTTLGREIEVLGLYVEIEKTRFEDRLSVTFDIAAECLDALVPHLLLQPLVENAVRHGTSKRSEPGEISVTARAQEQKLELWIRDNGPGVQAATEDLSHKGLGLSITQERLRTLYGDRQECKIRNLKEGGAEVHLCMPFSISASGSKMDEVLYRYM